MIQFEQVSIGYSKKPLLQNLNFQIEQGSTVAIVGPNGSGKTTLLKILLGIQKPLSGTVTQLQPIRFGYVPQQETINTLFPLSVLDIVLMGSYIKIAPLRRIRQASQDKALEALEHVDLKDYAHASFRNLSGGQKQRVLIARALVGDPQVLVLDEPTNGLDIVSQNSILKLIQTICEKDNLTLILVSHLINEIIPYVRQIGVITESTFVLDSVEKLMTSETMSKLFGVHVRVQTVDQRHWIEPEERP